MQLGEVPDPATSKTAAVDPLMARHSIDILDMLREKTKGNLTDQESQMLESMLYELRMKYVMKCGNA